MLLVASCLLFSFSNINDGDLKNGNYYLPANCEEPIYFQIESQEPYNAFTVNPDTGELSLSEAHHNESYDSFDGTSNRKNKIQINYNVTSADGVTTGHFIIIDLEVEE